MEGATISLVMVASATSLNSRYKKEARDNKHKHTIVIKEKPVVDIHTTTKDLFEYTQSDTKIYE